MTGNGNHTTYLCYIPSITESQISPHLTITAPVVGTSDEPCIVFEAWWWEFPTAVASGRVLCKERKLEVWVDGFSRTKTGHSWWNRGDMPMFFVSFGTLLRNSKALSFSNMHVRMHVRIWILRISWLSRTGEWGVVMSSGWRKDDLRLKNSCGIGEVATQGLSHVSPKKMGVSHLETAGDDSPPYLVDQDAEVPGSGGFKPCPETYGHMSQMEWASSSSSWIIVIVITVMVIKQ